MRVQCWDCPNTYDIAADLEGQAWGAKTIKRRIENDTDSMWMGLCPLCSLRHARADDPTKVIRLKRKDSRVTIQGVYDATRNILLTADELRENDLDLSREDSIHLAVDLHFAPELEVHPAFREFLLQRQTP